MTALKTAQFTGRDLGGRSGDKITEGIGGVVAASALLIEVAFEHITGPVRIMLQIGQTFEQPRAALVDKERGQDAGVRIAETLKNCRPTGDAIHAGAAQI